MRVGRPKNKRHGKWEELEKDRKVMRVRTLARNLAKLFWLGLWRLLWRHGDVDRELAANWPVQSVAPFWPRPTQCELRSRCHALPSWNAALRTHPYILLISHNKILRFFVNYCFIFETELQLLFSTQIEQIKNNWQIKLFTYHNLKFIWE